MHFSKRMGRLLRLPVVGLAFLAAALSANPASAQTNPVYNVDTDLDAHDANTADGICASAEGKCTLRAALEQNNAMPGPQGHWGLINLPAGEYLLTLGELKVTTTVSITGAGPANTRIDANRVRAFLVRDGQTSFFSNFTIYNGITTAENSGTGTASTGGGIYIPTTTTTLNLYRVNVVKCSADWIGGGIYSVGTVSIQEGRFIQNSAPPHDASGVEGTAGAIYTTGNMDITRSEFSENLATWGGAIVNYGKLRVTNSTFSGNGVTFQGGAIMNGGHAPDGYARINFCTFTGNKTHIPATEGQSAPSDSMQGGGAIFNTGDLDLANSVIAGNEDLNTRFDHKPTPDCWSHPFETFRYLPDLSKEYFVVIPTFNSYRNNIVSRIDASTCDMRDYSWGDQRFDHVGTLLNPLPSPLGALSQNGGLTATHSILAGSLAVDGAPSRSGNSVYPCPETDQRGVPRPFDLPCDIGAFELTAQTDYMEAENGSATGAYFTAAYDVTASGNFYAHVPSNLPGSTGAPNEQQHLDIKIYVDNAGFYNIQGSVRAANIDQNSFWVKMDGFPSQGYLWDLPTGGSAFQTNIISDRGTGTEGNPQTPQVDFYLDKGVHTLSIYVRESGAQLDRIRLIPATAAFSTLEVEKTAMLYGAFLVGDDPMAGSRQYAYTPSGSPSFLTAPDDAHKIKQTVTVSQAGTYLIRAHVHAVFDEQNSFWVKVDGQPGNGYLWDITEANPTYGLDYVSNRGTGDSRNPQQDPVELTLSAGTHTIEVFTREAGTRLDNIGLELKSNADAKIISRNKPATASSSQSTTYAPGKAVDGNAGTRWASSAGDNQWVRIDLQARYRVHRVMLYWDAAYGKDYDIQLSEDGNTWTTYYSMRAGTGGADNLILDGIGRYVRVKGIAQGTSQGYSLKEFDVYGTPAAGATGGFVCEGACLSAEPTAKYQTKILNTTGERWYVVDDVVSGWQASETAGRQIFVNGVQVQPGQMPLPARVNGKYYFRFSPGQYSWASWSFWN